MATIAPNRAADPAETDADLTVAALAGDEQAFDELYRRHQQAAFRVARAVLRNDHDARDAVAESFERVFGALPTVQAFKPYLLTAVRNAAIGILRRAERRDRAEAGSVPADGADLRQPVDRVVADEDERIVVQAFTQLPHRWRRALWLIDVEGLSTEDAGVALGVKANNAAQLASRARLRLREHYLQAHVPNHIRPHCSVTVSALGSYVAETASPRTRAKVDAHLASCAECQARVAELRDVASVLRRAVLPLPLLVALTRDRSRGRLLGWFDRLQGSVLESSSGLHELSAASPAIERVLAGTTAAVLAVGLSAVAVSAPDGSGGAASASAGSPPASTERGGGLPDRGGARGTLESGSRTGPGVGAGSGSGVGGGSGATVGSGVPAAGSSTDAPVPVSVPGTGALAGITPAADPSAVLGTLSDVLSGAGIVSGAGLTGTNLPRLDLTGASLPGLDLTGANLPGLDLTRANLTSANLAGADLTGLNLSSANLSSANLAGANLSGLNLSSANLAGANLTSANLAGANLSGANLSGLNLSTANLAGARLAGADLSGANLSGLDLSGADLSGANLTGAALSGANLAGAALAKTDLSGADLTGTVLRGAQLPGADPSATRLVNADRDTPLSAAANPVSALASLAAVLGLPTDGTKPSAPTLPALTSLVNPAAAPVPSAPTVSDGLLSGPGSSLPTPVLPSVVPAAGPASLVPAGTDVLPTVGQGLSSVRPPAVAPAGGPPAVLPTAPLPTAPPPGTPGSLLPNVLPAGAPAPLAPLPLSPLPVPPPAPLPNATAPLPSASAAAPLPNANATLPATGSVPPAVPAVPAAQPLLPLPPLAPPVPAVPPLVGTTGLPAVRP